MQLNYFQVLAGLVFARVAWLYLAQPSQPPLSKGTALNNGVTYRMRGLQEAGKLHLAGHVSEHLMGGRPYGRSF